MKTMRFIWLFLAGIMVPVLWVTGQISQGGKPIDLPLLKSAYLKGAVMPPVNNKILQMEAEIEDLHSPELKPLRFAHPFEVCFSPEDAGEWVTTPDGTDVWRMMISSPGAYSLNLIFSDFSLPENARLFVFNDNGILGAYTSFNNKSSGWFAISPLAGDEITVQYEIPGGKSGKGKDFIIQTVNHDFLGILQYNLRRPLDKVAGACNVDVNCGIGETRQDISDAVCRLIVNGKEICSGTLLNNTSENHKPYVISAAHCYDKKEYAKTTIYTFNYESPYCAPLDGDPANSVSGALMKAQFDSLDFALVELSLVPPPEFRPYYAGWDRTGRLPDSTVSIHHPQGDIKKLSSDADKPEITDFNSHYTKSGFFRIARWEYGVTESGSSGGALFNPQGNVVGTLTGGLATCSNPVKDYFSRFDLAWNYKKDSTLQLKYWLDPGNTGAVTLSGKRIYSGKDSCQAFTHLNDQDDHQLIPVNNPAFQGYWGGTNNYGITEITEKFSVPGNEWLHGISLGLGKVTDSGTSGDSEISVVVYSGTTVPEYLIHSQKVSVSSLVEGVMNYIPFSKTIEPGETFFAGISLSGIQPSDTVAMYQSLRPAGKENYFYYKRNNQWLNYKETNSTGNAMAGVIELVACNIRNTSGNHEPSHELDPLEILVYPNPASSAVTVEAGSDILPGNISVFNLLGKKVDVLLAGQGNRKVSVNLAGNVPGIYFIRINLGNSHVTGKVSWIPW